MEWITQHWTDIGFAVLAIDKIIAISPLKENSLYQLFHTFVNAIFSKNPPPAA